MRRLLLAACGLLALLAVASIGDSPAQTMPPGMPAMDRYQFGVLKKGKAWTSQRTAATDSIQRGHMANISRMHDLGLLVGAGPLNDRTGDLRGVFVFRTDSVERIRVESLNDPAIASGRLELDLYPWFAPARIGEPYKARQARGVPDSMVTRQLVLLSPGPKYSKERTPELMKMQMSHVANVFRLLGNGEAAAAGPFMVEEGPYAGVFVFRGDSASARSAVEADPAVKAGHLKYRQVPWYVAYGTFPGDTL